MENKVIEIQNVKKTYDGFAIDNMSFSVTKGSIHGFIGQNGAGKTTTIRAILNMLKLEAGDIKVFGMDADKDEIAIKENLGVVFDEMGFHVTMKPTDIDRCMRYIYKNWESDLFFSYLERFGLPKKRPCGKFSRGMRMKLQIAVALSHNATLLILDEPTSGLDPVVRNEILDIFQEFIEDGEHTVFLSSHILSDLERISDEITFIHKGEILLSDNKDDLMMNHGVIRCTKDEAKNVTGEGIVYKKESNYGCEILVNNAREVSGRYPNLLMEKATLEEIMLLYIDKQNAQAAKSQKGGKEA